MFLNCGEFVEINSDFLATYLFNDLSKTYTNVLQITKFYKNHKKFLNVRAGQTAGRMQIFFFRSSPIFSGKIVNLRTCRLFYFYSSMLCGNNLDPHFPNRRVEYH